MTSSQAGFLEIVGLEKRFGDFRALQNIDLSIEKGTVTCIVGPSGSGKSTLLRTINMLETIDGGAVFFQGEMMGFRVSGDRRHAVSAAKSREQTLNFGMVFQSFNLFPNYTALENVMLAPAIVGKAKKKEFRQRAEELLRRVGLTDKMDNYPSELSGGQQQRVAIARALAMEPKILLFDEPTSALDPELVGEVLAVMRELALKGSTMLIVTHEMKFAQDVADTIVMMDEGRIIERGTPDQLLNRPTTERTRKFFASVND